MEKSRLTKYDSLNVNVLLLIFRNPIRSVTNVKIKLIRKSDDAKLILDMVITGTSQPGPSLFNNIIHIIIRFEIKIPIADLYI
jgi:hypothetical protein